MAMRTPPVVSPAVLAISVVLFGCSGTTSYVRSDTALGRVVVYRNGVAYFERTAKVDDDVLRLSVPADKVDDFLKSLTVTDAKTGERAPIDFPNAAGAAGFTEMKIHLVGKKPHELKLTYVTEAPAWKPSYRVVLDKGNKVAFQGWAIVDNTSGEDWHDVKLGVGSSSALSFRFDLRSVRLVDRETLRSNDAFAKAPPMGGATLGESPQERRVLGELTDGAIARATPSPAVEEVLTSGQVSSAPLSGAPTVRKKNSRPAVPSGAASAGLGLKNETFGGVAGVPGAAPPVPGASPVPAEPKRASGPTATEASADYASIARSLKGTRRQVVIEGYADKGDADKSSASVDRANRVRAELLRHGVDPSQVVAQGQGERAGRAGGVRIIEAPLADTSASAKSTSATAPPPQALDPIGTSHFESRSAMTVLRGTSAMVSILDAKTEGEVVYLYDAESPRGNASFPFKAVRLQNPTDSVLESGPVTVFGEGRFIGEGLAEPIPARSTAFIPFALDRQVTVERKDNDGDSIARILSVQRGIFSSEVEHTRRFGYVFHNRLGEPATVYVRHTIADGYKLKGPSPARTERIGGAHLFRVDVPANGHSEFAIEEATPVYKTIDLRSPADMDKVRLYLSSGAIEGPLKGSILDLMKTQQDLGNLEQRIMTTRDQMKAYRTRMDELHEQIVNLRAVKTGGNLMRNLEKKLQEVSDRLSQATTDLAGLEEKAMLLRIHFQDGVAELTLEKK